jgi:hypothetical protein
MTSRETFGSAGGAGTYVPAAPLSRRASPQDGQVDDGSFERDRGLGRHLAAHDLEASPRRPIGSSLGFGD